MEPTLADQDRLIVNKALYRFFGLPEPGDIVMLYYPRDPDKSFVKRVIAQEGDSVRIEDGRVYVNEVLLSDDYVPPDFRSHENHGPEVKPTTSPWATIATTVLTADIGAKFRNATSSEKSSSAGGP